MKSRIRNLLVRPLSFSVLLIIAAALTPLFLHTDRVTYAQTESGTGLTVPALVAEATAGGVALRWEAVPDAVRYELAVWWDVETGWQWIGGDNLTGTTYTHSDITAGTRYYYSIRAVNAAGGTSAWLLDYASATATGSALVAPTLTAAATARGVALSWEAVPDAVRYELAVWWDAETGWQWIGGDNLTATTYTHSDITAGTRYYYSIRAVNAAGGTSAWLLDYASAVATSAATPTETTAEREALVAFYEETGGANWGNNDNWLTDAPLSDWYGVATDRSGFVVELRLSGNELSGSIPDLSALTNLTWLDLNNNQLSGSVPDLSALANLNILGLNNNELSGSVPDLSALSNLTHLDLKNNELCLSEGTDLSVLSDVVATHLESLNLPTCEVGPNG